MREYLVELREGQAEKLHSPLREGSQTFLEMKNIEQNIRARII